MFTEKFSRRDFIRGSVTFTIGIATMDFFPNELHAAEPCKIRTRYGIYNAFVDKNGVQTWLSIPYAQPPVRKLRVGRLLNR